MFNRIFVTIIAVAALTFAGCDGVGLFATIAVSEKIEEGSLPEGLSASGVVNAPVGANSLDDYDFFSGGVRLWARNNQSSDNKWFQVPLIDDAGTQWDGIQSIVASNDRIWISLINVNGSNVQVTLASVTLPIATLQITRLANTPSWSSTGPGYVALRLFCPTNTVLTDPVYVNVINHSASFGEEDTDNLDVYSSLYSIDGDATDWVVAAVQTDADIDDQLDGTIEKRYVTGIADSGTRVLVSATTSSNSSNGGILMDDTGTIIDYSGGNVAIAGVTWLDDINASVGAFIMGGTALSGGTRQIFASIDGATTTWEIVGQTSGEYSIENFIDVSNSVAGAGLVLAGTQSLVEDSTSEPSGYFEITVDPVFSELVSQYFLVEFRDGKY